MKVIIVLWRCPIPFGWIHKVSFNYRPEEAPYHAFEDSWTVPAEQG